MDFLKLIGFTVCVMLIVNFLSMFRMKLKSTQRYKEGYQIEKNFYQPLASLGIPEDIAQAVLQEFRSWPLKDFPVLPEDNLAKVYGLSEFEDLQDLVEELAKACHRKAPDGSIMYEFKTVEELALFITKMDKQNDN